MSISKNFPSIVPSLNLNFARSQDLDPRITFTRGSSATYVDDTGLIRTAGTNQARFDHDPVTLDSLGLLIEESRTNSLLRSNTFNTTWSAVSASCVFTQNVTGPDGVANSAWTIDDQSTAADAAGFEQSVAITPSASTNYCLSIFAKKGTANYFDFYAFFVGNSVKASYLRYNFSTDTLGVFSSDGGGITPTIYGKIAYPNGWYRFYFVVNDANNGLNNTLQFRLYPGSRDTAVTGTTLFYGAQLETGAFPTSYIATTTATVTRSADNASITGTNFSGFYNSLEWTLMVAGRRNYSGNYIGYPTIARIGDGTANNTVGFYGVDASTQFTNNAVVSGGVSQTTYEAVTTSGTSLFKMIQALSTNNSTFGANGTLTTTDTSVTMPSGVNNLAIGSYFSGGNYWGGTIAQILYYPKVLSNAQLQTITR